MNFLSNWDKIILTIGWTWWNNKSKSDCVWLSINYVLQLLFHERRAVFKSTLHSYSNVCRADVLCRLLLALCISGLQLSVLLVVKIYVFCHLRSCELFQLHNCPMSLVVVCQPNCSIKNVMITCIWTRTFDRELKPAFN
jgi:hypothetical protein